MVFAFDYDGTLKGSVYHDQNECLMWRDVMSPLVWCGHTIIIATMRTGCEADRLDIQSWLDLAGLDVPIIFCGDRGLKDEVCRADGYRVDVWVDDMPESIRQPIHLFGAFSVPTPEQVPKQGETSREAFENWYRDRHRNIPFGEVDVFERRGEGYVLLPVESGWQTWQAAIKWAGQE